MTITKPRELGIIGDSIAGTFDETKTEPGSIVVRHRPDDPTRQQWMRLAELSAGLEFWNDPAEDIYTEDDGEPL